MKPLSLAITMLLMASCTSLPGPISHNDISGDTNTGSITIHATRKMRRAYMTLNDSIVINGKSFKSVKIESVPEKSYKINMASKQTWGRELHSEKFETIVLPDKNTDIIVNTPSGTLTNVVYLSFIGLFASIPFLFL